MTGVYMQCSTGQKYVNLVQYEVEYFRHIAFINASHYNMPVA